MGLLEKAFQYKTEINKKGEKTLIDKITGPAETSLVTEKDNESSREDELVQNSPLLPEKNLQDTAPASLPISDDLKVISADLRVDHEIISDGIQSIETIISETDKSGVSNLDGIVRSDVQPAGGIKIFDIQEEEKHKSPEISEYLSPEAIYFIARTHSEEELFDELIFQIIGQLAVTSASIIWKCDDGSEKWEIVYSRGITLSDEDRIFSGDSVILNLLEQRKDIIDIEEFNSNSELTDEYIKFIGIDGRVLTPIILDDIVMGAVVTGDKITADEYEVNEKMLLKNLVDISSGILSQFKSKKAMGDELARLQKKQKSIAGLNNIIHQFNLLDQDYLQSDYVDKLMKNAGVDNYCVFVAGNNFLYEAKISGPGETIEQKISDENDIIRFIKSHEKNAGKIILPETYRVYGENILKNSHGILKVYPCFQHGVLQGFGLISEISTNGSDDDFLMLVFGHLILYFKADPGRGRESAFFDTYADVISRVKSEMERVQGLGIPLALINFSFKNIRRFYSEGADAEGIFNLIEEIVKPRLSGRDQAFRFDYNKILFLLPGKDKKYAATLGNILRNDLAQKLSRNNVQLLSSFITATYPDDGISAYELIDQLF